LAFTDWTIMLKNLADSFLEVERLVSGAFYVIGVGLLVNGLIECRNMSMGHQGGDHDKFHIMMKIVVGVFLIYLPSSLQITSSSFFGSDSVLSFVKIEPITVYQSIKVIMQLAGLIWFGRGLLMLYESNENARLKSYISFAYVAAGICAINLDLTIDVLSSFIDRVMAVFKML
jgi:intracellular multiplication protein IcmC